MGNVKERAEKHAAHGVTGFELSAYLLQNLYKYKLSPSAKNVLWYLSMCHNGKKGYVFPKQKTIAQKLSLSERSVIRGIQELVREGLIVVECNLSNKYFWGPKILSECPHFFAVKKLSDSNDKIASQSENLSHHVHEQIKEEIKEQTKKVTEQIKKPVKVEDYKILKRFAEARVTDKKNVNAYVNTIIRNGGAENTIAKQKEKEAADRFAAKRIKETQEMNAQYREWVADDPKECEAWVNLKNIFLQKNSPRRV